MGALSSPNPRRSWHSRSDGHHIGRRKVRGYLPRAKNSNSARADDGNRVSISSEAVIPHWKRRNKNIYRDIRQEQLREKTDRCLCQLPDRCGDQCITRQSTHECYHENCAFGKDGCTNRELAEIEARPMGLVGATSLKASAPDGYGIFETDKKGFGIKATRDFKPNEAIMEYKGEIITEAELERRKTQGRKDDNVCYFRSNTSRAGLF